MLRLSLTALLLTGCPTSDDKPADTGETVEDIDGDGYAGEADCDQFDADVNPGAIEICDGIDNNCDDLTDPPDSADAEIWYADTDVDGRGDPANTTPACDQPTGYVSNGTDCDDAHAEVYPGHPEECDGLDNDCDGEVDPPTANGTAVYFADTDHDGYGDGAVSVQACDAPDGYVEDYTDCDDQEARANPGAAEVCDGIDNDCDGSVDPDTAEDAGTWYRDDDRDGYGTDADVVVTCDQPTGYVAAGGDCDDDQPEAYPYAVEICDGLDNDCDGSVDPATSADASRWYGDADGDGYAGSALVMMSCEQPSGYYADAADCDDAAAAVNPAATEICNGVDDNCDRTVDPDSSSGAPVWHRDADSDSYGSATVTYAACSMPAGYVDNGDDCNDADPGAFPGNPELCDGVDNDCDGTIDPASSAGATVWYADADHDGYGNAASTTSACTAPVGYVSNTLDCNDTSASAHPGGSEVCDGLDNDCDGVTDPASSSGAPSWYRDADGDGFGGATSVSIACTQPSGYAATNTDCNDADASVNPDAYDVAYDGIDQDCDGSDLTCSDGTVTGLGVVLSSDTYSASNSTSSSCGGTTGADESWYWEAPAAGYYRFSTEGSNLDSVLAVTSGDCENTELACNDDAYADYTSALNLQLAAGEGVIVTVDGYGTTSDTYNLSITQLDPASCTTGYDTDGDGLTDCLDSDCAGSPACSTALADYNLGTRTGSNLATGSTTAATPNWSSPCATTTSNDVAYAWTAPAAGTYTFSLQSSTFDTVLTLYSPDGATAWDCNDDDFPRATSRLLYDMQAGQTVIIVIDGYSTYTGTYYLGIY